MSMHASLHNPTHADADTRDGHDWLNIFDASGNRVTLFIPQADAQAIAAIINKPAAVKADAA